MSNIEEKILNGPQVHYCDVGDDDIRHEEQEGEETNSTKHDAASLFTRPDEETLRLERACQVNWRGGASTQTGPKGVIEDYRRQKNAPPKVEDIDELEAEFQSLLNDDSILKEYVSKRISDAMKLSSLPTFGHVFRLETGAQLLDAIDQEHPNVLVLVHIYTKYSRPCINLNRCIETLAQEMVQIKFVSLDANATGLSNNFKENGVPALLAYKSGDLVKSLLQLEEHLDKDFGPTQVKGLLIDNGLII